MCPSQSANGDLGAIKSSAADPKSRTTTGLVGSKENSLVRLALIRTLVNCEGMRGPIRTIIIVVVLVGRDFSAAGPRFAVLWCCWKADQSIMRCCKGEVFEH